MADPSIRHPAQTSSRSSSLWISLRGASAVAAGVHVAFLALFIALGVPRLVTINVVSVLVFCTSWWLLGQRRNALAGWLIAGEICAHAGFAVIELGRGSGFQYYLLALVAPLAIGGRSTLVARLLGIVTVGVYFEWLDTTMQAGLPRVSLDASVLVGLRWLNLGATVTLMTYVAWLYSGLIRKGEAAMQVLATTDLLTGLNNRRRMIDIARSEQERLRAGARSLCILLCDIDHFKAVNDSHGHEVGDRALSFVARAMVAALRPGDSVARWGGEEFLVLMGDVTPDAARLAAERLREAVAATPMPLADGGELVITMTVGAAMLRQDEAVDDAIARADEALYRGKAAGRNCVRGDSEPLPAVRVVLAAAG